jgi:hypothetical protein
VSFFFNDQLHHYFPESYQMVFCAMLQEQPSSFDVEQLTQLARGLHTLAAPARELTPIDGLAVATLAAFQEELVRMRLECAAHRAQRARSGDRDWPADHLASQKTMYELLSHTLLFLHGLDPSPSSIPASAVDDGEVVPSDGDSAEPGGFAPDPGSTTPLEDPPSDTAGGNDDSADEFLDDLMDSSNAFSLPPDADPASPAPTPSRGAKAPKRVTFKTAKQERAKQRADNRNAFVNFVQYVSDALDAGRTVADLIDSHVRALGKTTALDRISSPRFPVFKYATDESYRTPKTATQLSKQILDNSLASDKRYKRAVFRRYGPVPPRHIGRSKHCGTMLREYASLDDMALLKGKTARQRRSILGHHFATEYTELYLQQTELIHLSQKLVRRLDAVERYLKKTIYDLKALGFKDVDAAAAQLEAGAHVHPSSAFAQVGSTLTAGKAILDSGASRHFLTTKMRALLTKPRSIRTSLINANGVLTSVEEGGDFYLPLSDSAGNSVGSLPILNASILEGATFSLLSLHQLVREGAKFDISDPDVTYMVYRGYSYPLEVVDNLIVIDLEHPLPSTTATSQSVAAAGAVSASCNDSDPAADHASCMAATASMQTWHDRLGHVSKKRIRYLNKSGSALGLNITNDTPHNAKCPCETCMRVNNISHSASKFREFDDTVASPGALLTCDLMGPFPADPLGNRYAFGFTDEYSRYSNVYLLKSKDEAPAALDAILTLTLVFEFSKTICCNQLCST